MNTDAKLQHEGDVILPYYKYTGEKEDNGEYEYKYNFHFKVQN